MRRPGKAGGVGLLLAALCAVTGCFSHTLTQRSAQWMEKVRGNDRLRNRLHIQTAIIDQPAGDPYLNNGFWDGVVSPVSHEQSTLLAQNGLRVGVRSGMLPTSFTTLVESDHHTLERLFRTMQPEMPKIVALNGPLPVCKFQMLPDLAMEPKQYDFSDAECGLSVVATPESDGRVTLHCQWQIQHGDRELFLKPLNDDSGFSRKDQKPKESFPTLDFEVTLGAKDYLVLGLADEPAGTLGEAFFVAASPDRVRQRALVIQAGGGSDLVTQTPAESPPLR